jgi:hypothetical protein
LFACTADTAAILAEGTQEYLTLNLGKTNPTTRREFWPNEPKFLEPETSAGILAKRTRRKEAGQASGLPALRRSYQITLQDSSFTN